jgi:hypothetical protein
MKIWMRGISTWSVWVLGLGFAACDSTSLVGAQSQTGGAGSSATGGAGTGAPPVVDWPAEGLGASSGGQAGPWLFFDSLRGSNRDIFAIQPDGSSLKRMTTSASIEREPAVSPDGKTLAFASNRSGVFQVYLMPLPGGVVHRLTNRMPEADQPAWSPDGTQLAFHSDDAVYVIGVDGQGERLAVELERAGGLRDAGHPTFARADLLVYDSYNSIDSVNLGTGEKKSILPGFTGPQQRPSISPDGHLFAFSMMCEQNVNAVWLKTLASPGFGCRDGTRVTVEGYARFPAIAPTGGLIAFEHGDTTPDLAYGATLGPARIGVADGVLQVSDVTHGEGDDRNPSWSPASLVLP